MIYLVKLGDPRPRSADDQGNQLFINQAELVGSAAWQFLVFLFIFMHMFVMFRDWVDAVE